VTGDVVEGLDDVPQPAYVLHAGTGLDADGRVVSTGGRVLSVTGTGKDLAAARDAAYAGVGAIRLRGSHHRGDIAARAVAGDVTVPVAG
jgi:phosphoribosylamine--glycine ligase